MTTIPQLSADALQALAKYDTPTICNAIELFDVLPRNSGYMNGSIKACFPKMPPMIGYALTTTFRSMSPPRGGDVYAGIDQQLSKFTEIPGPPVIVFQDLDEPVAAATFGEVMCSTYKTFGAKGIVTSGAGRDLDQVVLHRAAHQAEPFSSLRRGLSRHDVDVSDDPPSRPSGRGPTIEFPARRTVITAN